MDSELAAIWGCNSVNIVSLCSSEGFKNVAFCFTATVFLFVYRSLSFLLWPLMFPLFSSSPFSLSPAASLCYCHFPFPVGVKFASIIIMLFCVYGLPWHILCVQRLFIKLGKTNYKMPKPTFSAAKKKKKQPASLILPPCESVFELISISSKQPRWMCHFCVLQNSSRSLNLGHAWWNMCSMLAELQRPQCWVMHRTFPPRDRGSCPVGVKIDYIHHQFK